MKHRRNFLICAAALICGAGATSASEPIVVDGFFEDWTEAAPRVADARGDARGPTDILSLSAERVGEHVYLRMQTAAPANLHKPDDDGGLRIEITGAEETVTIETGERRALRDGTPVPWGEIDYVGLPTHAASMYEIRVRAPAGSLTINIAGSDTLDTPLTLATQPQPAPPREVDITRGDAPVRVVVWNVLHGGPFNDPQREPDGRTVIDTLDPDVLLLQEVWRIPQLEQRVRAICGDDWSVHEIGGVAVASRFPITPLQLDPPVELDNRRRPKGGDTWSVMRNLFVGVDTPVGPIVCVSAHWKCCGSLGSDEDIQRMDDALVALKAIWRLRDAGVPARPRRDGTTPHKAPVPGRFADAPILFAGDYNLVGSREPLDMLMTQGFIELRPVQSDEWNAATWRSPDDERIALGAPVPPDWEPGGFPQGRLDFAVVDPRIDVSRSFIADLGEPTLLSDHLPIVIDIDNTTR